MHAFAVIIPIYLALFIFYGSRNIKGYLLLTGIISLPFRTTYTIISGTPHTGWTQGITVSISNISFILLFLYLLFFKKQKFNTSSKIILPSVGFIVACALSVLNSTASMWTFYQVVTISQIAFLYYFVLTNSIENQKELNDVLIALAFVLLFQGILGALQYITGMPFDPFKTGRQISGLYTLAEGMDARRVIGTIGKPNGFALYVVPLLLLNLTLLIGTKQLKKLRFMATLFGGIGLILSFSRGGWLAFSFAFLILLFKLRKARIIKPKNIIFILVISAIIISSFFSVILTRIGEYDNKAAMSRIPLIKIAFNMIKEHPFLGVGVNTFRTVIHSYTNSPDLQGIYLHEAHNMYLLVFAEVGLIGIVTFLWLMIAFYKEASPFIQQKKSRYFYLLGLGIRLGFISAAVHMMVDMYVAPILLSNLFILAGLLTSAQNFIEQNVNIHIFKGDKSIP